MEVDNDLNVVASPSLKNTFGKKSNSKPVLKIIGIIILILLIFIFVFVFINNFAQAPIQNDQNDSNEYNDSTLVFDPNAYCVPFSIMTNPSMPYAIAVNGNTSDYAVSLDGSNSTYFMIFDGNTKNFLENPFAGKENNYSEVVSWLKGLNTNAIILGTPKKEFALEMKNQSMRCYNSTELIKFIIKEEKPFDPNDLYCKPIASGQYGKLSGKIAITVNENDDLRAVSLDDYKAPIVLVYENKNFIEEFNNPGTISSLITSLKDKNISTIIAGTPGEDFALALETGGVTCYNSTEIVRYIVNGEI